MKNITIAIVAACCLLPSAGNAQKKSAEQAPGVVYTLPRTAVSVTITMRREVVRKGPYARYAQKYLGAIAPLADKELYSITSAVLGYEDTSDPSKCYTIDAAEQFAGFLTHTDGGFITSAIGGSPTVAKHSENISVVNQAPVPVSNVICDTAFVKAGLDRTSSVEQSPEAMAADAANMLFTLRKRRFDLITGEAGENVYGSGLFAAIAEMSRLENEYVALFMGKQSVQEITREYIIVPDSGKINHIVCRFSDQSGLLPDNDLSGKPVVLEIKAESKGVATAPKRNPKDTRPALYYRIPVSTNARVLDGKDEIARQRIPLAHWGAIIDVPVGSAAR